MPAALFVRHQILVNTTHSRYSVSQASVTMSVSRNLPGHTQHNVVRTAVSQELVMSQLSNDLAFSRRSFLRTASAAIAAAPI